jgi:hypothetical protein
MRFKVESALRIAELGNVTAEMKASRRERNEVEHRHGCRDAAVP